MGGTWAEASKSLTSQGALCQCHGQRPEGKRVHRLGQIRATSSKYLGEPCLGRPASGPHAPRPAPPLTAGEVVLHQASVPLVVTFPLVRLLLRGAWGRGAC